MVFVNSWNNTSLKFNIVILKIYIGDEALNQEIKKIILSKEIQNQMIEFFLKISIPRIKQKKQRLLSENNSDGSVKND